MDEFTLLEEYARDGSQQAFARLVERYGGIVYAAARRQVRDIHLAEDVAQAVFIVLARRAGTIRPGRPLSAWLLQTTRYAAANARRSRSNQLQIETRAAQMNAEPPLSDQAESSDFIPLLDEGINRLKRVDRDALLLRFFEQKPLCEVGRVLGISEQAAQKRVSRAVDRLRDFFQRRGATTSAAVVAGFLAARATEAAPVGFNATATSTTASTVAKGVMAAMTAKQATAIGIAAAAALLVGVGTVAIVVSHQSAQAIVPANAPATASETNLVNSDIAPASPWRTTSASGGMVELVGVANFPVENGIWWKPDGSQQSDPAPQLLGIQPAITRNPGMRGYTLFVRSSVNGRQAVVYPQVQPPATTGYRRRVAAEALLQEMVIFVPDGNREATFGLGLDLLQLGQQRVLDLSGPGVFEEHVHDFGARGSMKVSPISDIDGRAQIIAEFIPGAGGPFFKNRRISLAAYDDKQAVVSSRQLKRENLPTGGVIVEYAFLVPAKQVTRLTCTLAPYEYVEFRGISLEPGRRISVTVAKLEPADPASSTKPPTTIPAFTETAP